MIKAILISIAFITMMTFVVGWAIYYGETPKKQRDLLIRAQNMNHQVEGTLDKVHNPTLDGTNSNQCLYYHAEYTYTYKNRHYRYEVLTPGIPKKTMTLYWITDPEKAAPEGLIKAGPIPVEFGVPIMVVLVLALMVIMWMRTQL